MSDVLTPLQREAATDGWHSVIVLGVSDLDVLHAHLTLAYCDNEGKQLWEKIISQVKAKHFLDRVSRTVNGDEQ